MARTEVVATGRDGEMSLDEAYRLLSNSRRRAVIAFLLERDGEPVDRRDVVVAVARTENNCESTDLTYKQRKTVYTALHQRHLPRLDRYGVVDYDSDRGTVTLGPNVDAIRPYLEEAPARWPLAYAAVTGLGGLVVLGIQFGVVAVPGLSDATATGLLLLGMWIPVALHAVHAAGLAERTQFEWLGPPR